MNRDHMLGLAEWSKTADDDLSEALDLSEAGARLERVLDARFAGSVRAGVLGGFEKGDHLPSGVVVDPHAVALIRAGAKAQAPLTQGIRMALIPPAKRNPLLMALEAMVQNGKP